MFRQERNCFLTFRTQSNHNFSSASFTVFATLICPILHSFIKYRHRFLFYTPFLNTNSLYQFLVLISILVSVYPRKYLFWYGLNNQCCSGIVWTIGQIRRAHFFLFKIENDGNFCMVLYERIYHLSCCITRTRAYIWTDARFATKYFLFKKHLTNLKGC
jgi:hypothetical protein